MLSAPLFSLVARPRGCLSGGVGSKKLQGLLVDGGCLYMLGLRFVLSGQRFTGVITSYLCEARGIIPQGVSLGSLGLMCVALSRARHALYIIGCATQEGVRSPCLRGGGCGIDGEAGSPIHKGLTAFDKSSFRFLCSILHIHSVTEFKLFCFLTLQASNSLISIT